MERRAIAVGKKNGKNKLIYLDDLIEKERIELDATFPIPHEKRECIYIAGPSGCGKSTWLDKYIDLYNKMGGYVSKTKKCKDSNVFLFSRVEDDPSIQSRINRIELDENNPVSKEDIPNDALCVFDDCDTIRNPNIVEQIHNLQGDLLETGRHENIYTIIVSHLLITNSMTRNRLLYNECTLLTIFPRAGNRMHMEKILKEQFGIDKHKIKEILDTDSRWVTISKTYPLYYITDEGAYIL